MSKRYNVCSPRPRKDKTHWHTVGSAFEDDKGVTIYLDSAPYPDAEGRVVLKLFEPRENNQRDGQRKPNGSQGHAGGFADDLGGDQVPF